MAMINAAEYHRGKISAESARFDGETNNFNWFEEPVQTARKENAPLTTTIKILGLKVSRRR